MNIKQYQEVVTNGPYNLLYNDKHQLVAVCKAGFIGLVGRHNADTVAQIYGALGQDIQKATFLFPGNNTHHTQKTTLFSKKDGAGLAALALNLHNKLAGATLSLPTKFLGTDQENNQVIERAELNFWQSHLAGQTLVLPIRAHYNRPDRHYFDAALFEMNGIAFEPSFWGGIVAGGDKQLAQQYMDLLQNALQNNPPASVQPLQPNDPFLQAQKAAPLLPVVHRTTVTNPFMDSFNGYTSDHAERTVKVNFISALSQQVDLSANVLTWNMMNKCYSKNPNNPKSYSNNPLNQAEDASQYLMRKRLQFGQFMQRIEESKVLGQPLDFLMLQEIDFLENPRNFDDAATQQAKVDLKKEFLAMLTNAGYDMVMRFGNTKRKALAVVFRKDAWIYSLNAGRKDVLDASGKSCGMEVNFLHRQSWKKCAITPVHLDFNHDYRQDIEVYQKQQVAQGRYMIMGGDTNHPQNYESESMIINFSQYPSNIDGIEDTQTGVYRPTDQQIASGGKSFLKCYDGFFVSPCQESYAHIVETQGSYFEIQSDGTVSVRALPDDRAHVNHTSLVGRAWKPTRYILRDMDASLPIDPGKLGTPSYELFLLKVLSPMVDIYYARIYPNQQNKVEFDNYASGNNNLPTVKACFQQVPTLLQTILNDMAVRRSVEFNAVHKANTVDELRDNLVVLQNKFPYMTKEQKQDVNQLKARVLEKIYAREQQPLMELKQQVSKFLKWGFLIVPLFIALHYHVKYMQARDKASVQAYELKKPQTSSFTAAKEKFNESPSRIDGTSGQNVTKMRKTYVVNSPKDPSFSKMGSPFFTSDSKERVRVYLTQDNDVKKFERTARSTGAKAVRI